MKKITSKRKWFASLLIAEMVLFNFPLASITALAEDPAPTIERVSVASDGTQGNGFSGGQAFSADGRYVVFESLSTNLEPSGKPGVFVHDRDTGITENVSGELLG